MRSHEPSNSSPFQEAGEAEQIIFTSRPETGRATRRFWVISSLCIEFSNETVQNYPDLPLVGNSFLVCLRLLCS
jgi:hypothetical protein